MTIADLITHISHDLSSRDVVRDYREELSSLLTGYIKLFAELDESEKQKVFPSNTDVEWTKLNNEIKSLSSTLKNAVKEYYSGATATCYNKIKNWMEGTRTHEGLLQTCISKHTIVRTTNLYRIRPNEKNNHFKAKDMFHIPFEKRGIIKTQRYSVPGYPCLYFSSSIYGCWEEMNKLSLDQFKVSRINPTEDISLLDLRLSPVKDGENDKLKNILRILPLIISCSIKVVDPDDTFKPEYIISQIVLQIIIKNRSKNNIYGVIFSSTQKNPEFDFADNSLLDNYAIPVIENKPLGLCPKLSQMFKITAPTCYEHELIRDPEGMTNGHVIDGGYATSSPADPIPYAKSAFGLLESRLKIMDLLHVYPITITN